MHKSFKDRLHVLKSNYQKAKLFNRNKIFKFGKYKGCTLEQVIDVDIEYLKFLMEHSIIELDKDALDYLERIAEEFPYSKHDFMNQLDDPFTGRR